MIYRQHDELFTKLPTIGKIIYNIPTFWDPPGHQLGIDDREIAGVGDFWAPNFVRSSGRSQVAKFSVEFIESIYGTWTYL